MKPTFKKRLCYLLGSVICMAVTGCVAASRATAGGEEMMVNVKSNLQHIDWMAMDINDDYITYDLDILSPEGKILLNNTTEETAKNLALSSAIVANQCDAIFQPRITVVKGTKGEILRVTVYGRPAKYKTREDVKITEKTTTVISR